MTGACSASPNTVSDRPYPLLPPARSQRRRRHRGWVPVLPGHGGRSRSGVLRTAVNHSGGPSGGLSVPGVPTVSLHVPHVAGPRVPTPPRGARASGPRPPLRRSWPPHLPPPPFTHLCPMHASVNACSPLSAIPWDICMRGCYWGCTARHSGGAQVDNRVQQNRQAGLGRSAGWWHRRARSVAACLHAPAKLAEGG